MQLLEKEEEEEGVEKELVLGKDLVAAAVMPILRLTYLMSSSRSSRKISSPLNLLRQIYFCFELFYNILI